MEKKPSGRSAGPGKANGTELKKSQGRDHNSSKSYIADLGKTDMRCDA
jgi:hypothetical protein